jgi:hypothetical protein
MPMRSIMYWLIRALIACISPDPRGYIVSSRSNSKKSSTPISLPNLC